MSKLNHAASADTVSPDGEESDDSISLTSTVSGHDPEQEFEVENILAERRFEDGNMYYLVEWTGFALHESTWEPESNLGSELKAMWEEDKAKHATGELEPFDIQKFTDALNKAMEEKADRHRRRNAKREKLGLPLTAPFPDQTSDSSNVKAVEQPTVSESAREPASRLGQNQHNISEDVPSSGPQRPSSLSPTAAADGSGPRDGTSKRPAAENHGSGTGASSSANRRTPIVAPPITGYQGTAKRASKTSTDALPMLKTRLPGSLPKPSPTSVRPTPAARKPLMAKKSTSQPAGNIFTSGKTRKARPGLKDVMSDPTKAAKLFDKHRHRRLAEKLSRDKEDIAPDISKVQLFDFRKGPTAGRRSSGALSTSPSTPVTPQQETPVLVESEQPPALNNGPAPAATNSDAATTKKKRKAVRFQDEDQSVLVQEPEQMDLDDTAVQEPPPILHPLPARKRPSLDRDCGEPPVQATQSSAKKLILGQSVVEVTFNGIPQESSSSPPAWLADFLAKEALEFRHTCFAKTVAAKRDALIPAPLLASGTIVARGDEAALARVGEYLTAGLLGLYSGQTQYNVLAYPTKCDEWKSIPLGQEPTSPTEAPLGYLIFTSPQDFGLLLPPLALPSVDPQLGAEVTESNTSSGVVSNARELVVQRLFGFEYNKLLPAIPRQLPVHNFFLAIPDSKRATAQALYHWLRASNPSCQIFTSHHAGGWEAFRARVESIPGVIIIHELLAWSLRRIPRLARYLITRNDEYWCLSEPTHALPLYPSLSVPECPVSPGDMRLTRLFPYRTAILLTPSFLVSEPRRTLEFFEWFMTRWLGKFHCRIVTAHNIHEYLSELADEKYQARKELWSQIGDVQPVIEENLSGLSREDCRCRYAAAERAADLHMIRTAKAGPYGHDEDSSSLVYADPSIDQNDEQSLVNWFGWWTTLRADQFRKFHVVGSSKETKLPGSRRSERIVRIPKYSSVTLNDPDGVLEVVQERNDQVEAAEGKASGDAMSLQSPDREDTEIDFTEFIQGPWSFRSHLIQREDSSYFSWYLDDLCHLEGFRFQWMLYKFPVSWLDLQMADHFGDVHSKAWNRIQDWFQFTFPFGAGGRNKSSSGSRQGSKTSSGPAPGYNTYIGFFYTIADDWDPDNLPEKSSPQRYPWIAIYRPVNLHRRPFERCEVIIWDPLVRVRYPGKQDLAEKDLIFMQRQLIHPHPGAASNTDSSLFVDQTATTTNDMDYTPMDIDPPSPTQRRPSTASSTSSAFHEDLENTRIIFHPPRAPTTTTTTTDSKHPAGPTAAAAPPRTKSKCVNRLYEEARLARARADPALPPPTHMLYRFPPTLEWYGEQRAEGRGYAHINVDSWEGVFKLLKIGEGAAAGAAAAAAGGAL
ncbi:cda5f31c-8282-4ee5-8d18-f7a5df44c32c [Thermothielavioides terrestris]|uniref:Cda5f31c-8282-4ee5-8d18-f7a5df44c32c n=1 Tax=Thermothielavioides terrestris TaxID=2587410 RepID=A0A446BYW0_9PEZI|nr:cda5f31c-8282-4ee5-8d18-f7a5df44c32c [Thermothielavioides terrestris]